MAHGPFAMAGPAAAQACGAPSVRRLRPRAHAEGVDGIAGAADTLTPVKSVVAGITRRRLMFEDGTDKNQYTSVVSVVVLRLDA